MATTQGRTSPNNPGSTNKLVVARTLPDGTQFGAPWLQKAAMDGNVYTAQSGSASSPNTFAAAYTATAPDLDMSVAPGTMVIPFALTVYFEAYGTSAQAETIAAIGVGGVIAPTSATAVTPTNARLDRAAGAPGVTIVSDGTGATYMTSNVTEFWRDGAQFAITKTSASATAASQDTIKYKWSAMETGFWPVMYHPTSITRLNVFCSSQAGTGFIILQFAVVPLTEGDSN